MQKILKLLILFALTAFTIQHYEIDLVPSSVYNKRYENIINPLPKLEELFLMKVKLGYPPQSFHLLVDTNTYPIWVQDNESKSKFSDKQITFNKEISQTFQKSKMKFNIDFDRTDRIKGEIITEKVNLGFETIQMEILLVDEFTSTLRRNDGILGIGKSFDKNKLTTLSSLVPALESLKKTESSLFSIHYFDLKVPKMIIGKAHEDFSKEKHTASCKTLKNKNNWVCKVDKLIHNNTAIPIDYEIVFDSTIEQLYFPDHLKTTFKSIISKTNCREFENEDGAYFDCITLDDWLPFALTFGDSVLKLPKEMLTEKYENNQFHKLKIMFTSKYKSEIHFGTSLFKHYHLLFDRVNENITFYSPNENNIGTINDYNLITKSSMDYVLLIILFAGFALSSLVIFKVVKTQLRKSKKTKFNQDFDESRYEKMKTINKEVQA